MVEKNRRALLVGVIFGTAFRVLLEAQELPCTGDEWAFSKPCVARPELRGAPVQSNWMTSQPPLMQTNGCRPIRQQGVPTIQRAMAIATAKTTVKEKRKTFSILLRCDGFPLVVTERVVDLPEIRTANARVLLATMRKQGMVTK